MRCWVAALGARRFTPKDLTMFSLLYGLNQGFYRAHPMPHQLEGFKLAERVGLPFRRLVFVLLFATVLGTFSAFWAFLHIAYRTPGGVTASGTGPQAFTQLQMWLLRPGGNGFTCHRLCRIWISSQFLPDGSAKPLSLVAPSSSRVCTFWRLDDEHAVAAALFQLVNQSDAAAVWWIQNAPTGGALLSWLNFGRVYRWQFLEYILRDARSPGTHLLDLMIAFQKS